MSKIKKLTIYMKRKAYQWGSLEDYVRADGWKQFKTFLQPVLRVDMNKEHHLYPLKIKAIDECDYS